MLKRYAPAKGSALESVVSGCNGETYQVNHSLRRITPMSGEMLNAALLSFGLIFVGWALGALLLKIQGVEE